jgi:hypothetical protein
MQALAVRSRERAQSRNSEVVGKSDNDGVAASRALR